MAVLKPHDRERLRWRGRRGLLENDILITRFLDAHEQDLSDDDVHGLKCLFELGDNDLLDLLLGRTEPAGALDCPEVQGVLSRLRVA